MTQAEVAQEFQAVDHQAEAAAQDRRGLFAHFHPGQVDLEEVHDLADGLVKGEMCIRDRC